MKKLSIVKPLLKGIWQLSLLLFFPVMLWAYLAISGTHFSQINSGLNGHKVFIFVLYLAFTAFWITMNKRLKHFFSQKVTP